ncbi:MAG: metallophosphoesterase [Acidobacteria bacterium]|nr:metallophosphoesterase [Acidobacteriota bacterium]
MRVVVHLSDLHFGRVDYGTLRPVIAAVRELQPHLVAVSGDLTQRARRHEFREAREFLDALPAPQIVVPGNHDVPLENALHRFLWPLARFRRYITDDLEPFYDDGRIMVAGVNTARALTIKGGRINERQVSGIAERFGENRAGLVKIVVTHHPIDLPESLGNAVVGRATMAIERLAAAGADLFLAGHMHVSYAGHAAARYRIEGRSTLVVQAGTATSTRGRGELNSFNVLRVEHPAITVERFFWDAEKGRFELAAKESFRHGERGWRKE